MAAADGLGALCGLRHLNAPVIEEIASGPAIADAFPRRTGRTVGGAEVLAAANGGDAIALDILNSAADQLGSLIALIVNMLDPEAIVLGGGLGLAAGPYRDRLIASTRAYIWAAVCRGLPDRGGGAWQECRRDRCRPGRVRAVDRRDAGSSLTQVQASLRSRVGRPISSRSSPAR
jgi:predicted NBD/HSP70 family sugar kinase